MVEEDAQRLSRDPVRNLSVGRGRRAAPVTRPGDLPALRGFVTVAAQPPQPAAVAPRGTTAAAGRCRRGRSGSRGTFVPPGCSNRRVPSPRSTGATSTSTSSSTPGLQALAGHVGAEHVDVPARRGLLRRLRPLSSGPSAKMTPSTGCGRRVVGEDDDGAVPLAAERALGVGAGVRVVAAVGAAARPGARRRSRPGRRCPARRSGAASTTTCRRRRRRCSRRATWSPSRAACSATPQPRGRCM